MRLKTTVTALLLMFCMGTAARAASTGAAESLIPSGETIGISVDMSGVLVLGVCGEESASPAWAAGIRSGDLIIAVGSETVCTAEELRAALKNTETAQIRIIRDGKEQQLTVTPQTDEAGEPELGLWLRSSLSGIGTVTYVDPETRSFGALGHSISDSETGVRLPIRNGVIGKAEVNRIVRGERGKPGELKGSLGTNHEIGAITGNSSGGIFGILEEDCKMIEGTVYPLAEPHCGPAVILSDISGAVREYGVEISRIFPENGGTRNLMLTVTDDALLSLTGGIVQGMSGSPILQDGAFCGAVTHVLLNDPTRGYGITIRRMLRERGQTEEADEYPKAG